MQVQALREGEVELPQAADATETRAAPDLAFEKEPLSRLLDPARNLHRRGRHDIHPAGGGWHDGPLVELQRLRVGMGKIDPEHTLPLSGTVQHSSSALPGQTPRPRAPSRADTPNCLPFKSLTCLPCATPRRAGGLCLLWPFGPGFYCPAGSEGKQSRKSAGPRGKKEPGTECQESAGPGWWVRSYSSWRSVATRRLSCSTSSATRSSSAATRSARPGTAACGGAAARSADWGGGPEAR